MSGPLQQRMPSAPALASSVNGNRPGKERQHGAPLSTRARPKGYAALAVALLVGFGALGAWFYTSAGSKVPVVMARTDIPVGHVIARDDLTTVDVAGGVTAVGGAHLSSLIGQRAAVEILPNTLVQRAMVTSGSPIPAGQVLVGVAAAPGQIPSSGLAPGDRVEILQLPQKGGPNPSTTSDSAVLVAAATVFDVRANESSSGGTLLSVIVPTATAYGVAQASNAGQIALVKLGG